ncbi:RNA degradosome polyphosphate kinase [Macrococcus armenti]|uniref:RNA degradosome polyphosphate kinase n=1 Tax=Macrococcus armenti TaxID=2875764 RepID=UPI001CC9725E|nr:RNA degradosome polyphosphate kinase [Macrococcus armenti]UBH10390.1 RNA degradosome polyphosphate kinase [Macrococcus armenti]UBH14921.1 RNA degradosome polyphosphate kinase [Macrococcus armenti]UBH17281.1 RNA degradosome polyphosphate kinase [Macrococcus armenti]UBH19546.1 RNA degradosome polyphosphate kinase [Macrococcus armenti]
MMNQNLDLGNKAYYNNREVSWIGFNRRVIEEAFDHKNPLLERIKFLAIASSNLDEFFMVRVGGLKDQVTMGFSEPENKTQMTPTEQLIAVERANRDNVKLQYDQYHSLIRDLEGYNIYFKSVDELSSENYQIVEKKFNYEILPTLTPLGIDAYRPFPKLANKSLNIFVDVVTQSGENKSAIVQIPALLNRIIELTNGEKTVYVLLEDVITHFIDKLFHGYQVTRTFAFRITRNADLTIHEDGAEDLLIEIEKFLKKRKSGAAVRLEIDTRCDDSINASFLKNELEIEDRDVYKLEGPLDLTMLFQLSGMIEKRYPQLAFNPFEPCPPKYLGDKKLYEEALERDIFFHHPYESFQPIVDFIKEASEDPNTLAIKQTLYRVSSDSPIIDALKNAAEVGKQVTVLVELKARFDEENNVHWARMLEEAGCHVIYGMTHLKTHSKITLVVKKVNDEIVSYVHLGTGNYNDKTAKIYTDMGIITTNKEIGEDAMNFFNYLSGYSEKPTYNKLHVAPFEIRDEFIEHINQEIECQKAHGNGLIIAKMNSLTDKTVIKKLYEASNAGVKIKLIIRGICCLKPGIPGISENIRVISIVGRFLEHSRIYYFYHNGEEKMYLSSADMMTRNMIKRVEILFPIIDNKIVEELKDILNLQLDDNQKAREQDANGVYHYVRNDATAINSQEELMNRAEEFRRSLIKPKEVEHKPMMSKRSKLLGFVKNKLRRN